jgi:hypothetical protein
MGQWLTSTKGRTPFNAQTTPVRPLATTAQIVDFTQTFMLRSAPQTFKATVPDDAHFVSGLTIVVGVPAIANQTQNAVTKHGVSGGVASLAFTGDASNFDGGAVTATIDAPDVAGGVNATVAVTQVPADVVATAAGVNLAVDNPGWGYTAAAVTLAGVGADSMDSATATAAVTAESSGENYRYVVPSKASGGAASALVATDSDAGTDANLGTAFLLESDVSKVHGIVAKAVTGLTFASPVDSNYHNSIDGGVQDIAPYYTPFCPAMMFDEIVVKTSQGLELFRYKPHGIVAFDQLYTPEGLQLGRLAHASRDVQQLKAWSARPDNRWFLRLPCFDERRPFPLHAAPQTQLLVQATTRPFSELVINGSGGAFAGKCSITASGTAMKTVTVSPAAAAVSLLGAAAPAATALGTAVAPTDFSLRLLVDGYLVDQDAATEMLTGGHFIPITQQVSIPAPLPLTSAAPNQPILIKTRLPIKALHWTGVLESNRLRNDHANFAAPGDPFTATAEQPQGAVPRAIFAKSQLWANGKPLTLKSGPEIFVGREQALHAARRPDPPLHVYSHHFCVGSPYDFQYDAYLGGTSIQFLELRLDPDPSLFADNSAVLGLDGTSSGTVAGGQTVHVEVWADCQNFIVVRGGTVSLLSM